MKLFNVNYSLLDHITSSIFIIIYNAIDHSLTNHIELLDNDKFKVNK